MTSFINRVTSFVILEISSLTAVENKIEKTETFWSEANDFKNNIYKKVLLLALVFSHINND